MQLGFYEWIVIGMAVLLLGIFAVAWTLKIVYDRRKAWRAREESVLETELAALSWMVEDPHYHALVDAFVGQHQDKVREKRYYDLMEGIFFDRVEEQEPDMVQTVLKIAYALGFPEKSMHYLGRMDYASIARGCMQAGAYRYEPAIGRLLALLKDPGFHQQYDVLRALAHFGDPEVILRAFELIQHHIDVNDRIARDLYKWLSPRNRVVLVRGILKMNVEPITAIFLKWIDERTALNVKHLLKMQYQGMQGKELRIAAIKAMSSARDTVFVKDLILALSDADWEIRAVAAGGLEKIPARQAMRPLVRAVSDPAWWVRQNAALALLALPNALEGVERVLRSGDTYAIESIRHAADLQKMEGLVNQMENMIKNHQTLIVNKTAV